MIVSSADSPFDSSALDTGLARADSPFDSSPEVSYSLIYEIPVPQVWLKSHQVKHFLPQRLSDVA